MVTMTPLQQRRIRNLRAAGWGYKNIAALCGLSRDQVRAFCKRENLEDQFETIEHVCAWCGVAMAGRSLQARFCCSSCRWSAWKHSRENSSDHARPCPACGRPFVSAKSSQKYCSHACYVRARFGTRGGRP